MSDAEAPAPSRPGRGRLLLFTTALILNAATYGIGILFNTFILPRIGSGASALQLYELLQSLALFVFNPGVSFVVFYKQSSRVAMHDLSDYVRTLAVAFAGGFTGYGVAFFGFFGYEVLIKHVPAFAPGANVALWLAQIGVALLGKGAGMSFVAFAGQLVGAMRRSTVESRPESHTSDSEVPEPEPT